MELANRTALVTGASQGIGKAIALALAEAGARVVVTARSGARLDAVVAAVRERGGEALAVRGDMGVEADVERVAAEASSFGGVDVLVNNAAIIHPPIKVIDFDPALWRQVLEVNLTGVFLMCRALVPGMIERGGGRIINIASIGGRTGARRRSAYRVTKAGLISFTQSLAAEVDEHGIAVNAICPGGVLTEGYAAAFGDGAAANPRLMRPEAIARVALFLASDASGAVTGTAVDAFGRTNPLFD